MAQSEGKHCRKANVFINPIRCWDCHGHWAKEVHSFGVVHGNSCYCVLHVGLSVKSQDGAQDGFLSFLFNYFFFTML